MRILVLAALALLAACSRHGEKTTPSPSAATAAAAARNTAAQRVTLFGDEAADAAIVWRNNGLGLKIDQPGEGRKPGIGDTVRLRYTGRLRDGTRFDRTEKAVDFQIGRTIAGLSTGLQALGTGGRATLYIPPELGYGARKVAGIPPDSGLIFDVEVLAINP